MKKYIIALLLITISILLSFDAYAISTVIKNDSKTPVTVRIRLRDKETQALYWTKWIFVHEGSTEKIESKNPQDLFFGFAMMQGDQATLDSRPQEEDGDELKGRLFLLSEFHSATTSFPEISQDQTITIRDARIEISLTKPDEKKFWTGSFIRN